MSTSISNAVVSKIESRSFKLDIDIPWALSQLRSLSAPEADRLEFLGDSLLEVCVRSQLCETFEDDDMKMRKVLNYFLTEDAIFK